MKLPSRANSQGGPESSSALPVVVWRDVAMVALMIAAFATLAVRQQWSENLFLWLRHYEWLDLDELILSLLIALLGLVWFASRRWLDLRRQWRLSRQLQTQRDALFMQNRELAQRILSAQENERRELARELHDEIAQSCTAIRFEAAFLARLGTQHEKLSDVQASAQRIEHTAGEVHLITRRMLERLRPAHLDSLGFESALQTLCADWQQQCGVPCAIEIDALPGALHDHAKTGLYRVVQEALTNVARHAQASQASVRLRCHDDQLMLQITDDGVGLSSQPLNSGLGLVGIRERMALLNGDAQWTSTQTGTRVVCCAPWQAVCA